MKNSVKNISVGAILTAFVVILQFLALFTRFSFFSITLVLIPIVVGSAICGVGVATWLGFVFGVTVLASGDASWFLSFSVVGTIATVLLKGTLCGLLTGIAYKALEKKNNRLSIWVASIICPVVNSGVFALGCYVFFLEDLMAEASKQGQSVTAFIFLGLIGVNFLVELLINIILNPTITSVIKTLKKQKV